MNLDIISKMISDAGLGVEGETLFLHHMPETCDNGIVLRLPLDGVRLNHYIPGFFKNRFQLIVRDTTFASGQSRAEAVSSLLTFYDRDFFDDSGKQIAHVYHVYPAVKPIFYPRLPSNLLEWSISFDAAWLEL